MFKSPQHFIPITVTRVVVSPPSTHGGGVIVVDTNPGEYGCVVKKGRWSSDSPKGRVEFPGSVSCDILRRKLYEDKKWRSP